MNLLNIWNHFFPPLIEANFYRGHEVEKLILRSIQHYLSDLLSIFQSKKNN